MAEECWNRPFRGKAAVCVQANLRVEQAVHDLFDGTKISSAFNRKNVHN